MTYEEYKLSIQNGEIRVGIDRSDALNVIGYLPMRYQVAHIFWSWVWILSIPGFICVSIFYKWWIGLILLFVVTPLISGATKDSAAQFVLEYAKESQEFYYMLLNKKVLIFRHKSS